MEALQAIAVINPPKALRARRPETSRIQTPQPLKPHIRNTSKGPSVGYDIHWDYTQLAATQEQIAQWVMKVDQLALRHLVGFNFNATLTQDLRDTLGADIPMDSSIFSGLRYHAYRRFQNYERQLLRDTLVRDLLDEHGQPLIGDLRVDPGTWDQTFDNIAHTEAWLIEEKFKAIFTVLCLQVSRVVLNERQLNPQAQYPGLKRTTEQSWKLDNEGRVQTFQSMAVNKDFEKVEMSLFKWTDQELPAMDDVHEFLNKAVNQHRLLRRPPLPCRSPPGSEPSPQGQPMKHPMEKTADKKPDSRKI
ncbi:hypothetical protein PspLS_02930 [Pyricularia sp. CBS 133598]|nr:hypothetical protein PspLS_02930 [Pyricularia sp. CBS 133598]